MAKTMCYKYCTATLSYFHAKKSLTHLCYSIQDYFVCMYFRVCVRVCAESS